jgi:prephenate dehydrogenase (NADP+)
MFLIYLRFSHDANLASFRKVLIRHRASEASLALVEDILRPLKSRYVYLSYEEHDIVTANTQAVTHAAFLR